MSNRLAEIRERLAIATPGPWSASTDGGEGIVGPRAESVLEGKDFGWWSYGDFLTCLHSRDDLAYLLDRVERSERALAEARAAVTARAEQARADLESNANLTSRAVFAGALVADCECLRIIDDAITAASGEGR